MSFTLGGPRGGRFRLVFAAVPLLVAAACETHVEEVPDIVLARHVHTDLYDAYPGIPSPAGDRVVFADYAADKRSLTVYDVASGVGRTMTSTPGGRTRVTWSPDGSHVVYVDRAGGWVAPVQSPDGRTVAYLRAAGARSDLAVTEIATGETRTLAADLQLNWDRRVEWSPAGNAVHLAAAGLGDSLFAGWRVPLDGSPAERLEHGGRDVLAVTPLADGRVALSVPSSHYRGPRAGDRRGTHRRVTGSIHERLPAFLAPRWRGAGVHRFLLATRPHAHRLRPGRPRPRRRRRTGRRARIPFRYRGSSMAYTSMNSSPSSLVRRTAMRSGATSSSSWRAPGMVVSISTRAQPVMPLSRTFSNSGR